MLSFFNIFYHFLRKFLVHPQVDDIENSYDEHVPTTMNDMKTLMMS